MPKGVRIISSSPSKGAYAANTGVWTVGKLAVGKTATLKIVAKVLTDDPAELVNKVTNATSGLPDPTPCDPDCGVGSIVGLVAGLPETGVGAPVEYLSLGGLAAVAIGGVLLVGVPRRRRGLLGPEEPEVTDPS